MPKTTMYGIANCDTIKKAKKWLTGNDVEFNFHDYRKDGLDQALLETLEAQLGWENLLNKRGTTFRKLSEEQKADLDREKALALLIEHPAMIKRPVLVSDEGFHLGFKAEQYQGIFNP
ncbi:MAG: Spx/MgsR family transcriptional regulator [Alteromonadaceae bacterium]|jgi:Spx/MgsR family transcriptional regulator